MRKLSQCQSQLNMFWKSKYKLTRKWKVWGIRKMSTVFDKISLHYFYRLHLILFGHRVSYCSGVLQRKFHSCHLCLITGTEKFNYWPDSCGRDAFHTKAQCAPIFLTQLKRISQNFSLLCFFFQWRGQQNNVNHLEISNCLFHPRMVICTHFLVCLYVVLLDTSAVNDSWNQKQQRIELWLFAKFCFVRETLLK